MSRTVLFLFAAAALATARAARAQSDPDSSSLQETQAGMPGADEGQAVALGGGGVTVGAPSQGAAAPAQDGGGAQLAAAAPSVFGGSWFAPGNSPPPLGAQAQRSAPQASSIPGSGAGDAALQAQVMARAHAVGEQINSTGGYRFDGTNDCYGFVRRTWNPILEAKGLPDLPVDDYPSANWAPITDWSALLPGDVLATAQGHHWGGDWHGGLSAGDRGGAPMVYDDTPGPGASVHPDEVFRYYYLPAHRLLAGR